MKRSLLLFILLFTFNVQAQIFRLVVTDYNGLENNPTLKGIIDNKVHDLQNEINDKIPDGSTNRILQGMGNASVVAGKSGADYSSHMQKYMIAVGSGGGIDLERQGSVDSDISGVGVAPYALVGLNMDNAGVHNFGGLDTKRLNSYLSFMNFGYGTSMNALLGVDSELKIKSRTLGVRMSYLWKEMQEHRNYTWGGIKLGWGILYNESHFGFEHDLNESFVVVDNDVNINGKVTGRPKYNVDVYTTSIPLEVSTDVTFFKFLTFYGGGAVDFNYGKAKGKGTANGNVSPQLCTDSGAICGPGGRFMQLQMQADAQDSAWVSPVTGRAFLGTQINMPYVQLYADVQKSVLNNVIGFGVGIRFVR